MKRRGEEASYPVVARWLKRHFRCFKVEINKGITYGRIDVIGVRDIGGELSGDIETIAIEVKKGATPFGIASGQTLSYKVYANRVYLADIRAKDFVQDELAIASHLGIGLIHVRGGQCMEVLSSPFYHPIPKLHLHLLQRLSLVECQLCGCFFETYEASERQRVRNVSRNVGRAVEKYKGAEFFLSDLASRKEKMGIIPKRDWTNERRFVCRDCLVFLSANRPWNP